ncbi:MAG: hypothetical protein JJU06_05045 [Ectothiorhodospiraceae bacterium]|nr:hypothetical protein [Ectothiorhodospiraceae bacterium]
MAFSAAGILAVLFELFRPWLLPLGVLAAIELGLLALIVARRDRLRVRPPALIAGLIGLVAAVAAALLLPAWSGASMQQLQSLLDFAAVAGMGIGIGVAIGLASYPPVQCWWILAKR